MTMGQVPEPMQDALAEALGITVDELKAQLEAGKTVPEIAAENGVDLATLPGTMQGAHAGGHAGMPFNRDGSRQPALVGCTLRPIATRLGCLLS